jgi:hypothetical protein
MLPAPGAWPSRRMGVASVRVASAPTMVCRPLFPAGERCWPLVHYRGLSSARIRNTSTTGWFSVAPITKRETKIEYTIVYEVRRPVANASVPNFLQALRRRDQSERGAQLQGCAWANQRLVKSLKRCALGNGGDEQAPHVVFRRITERTHTTYCA